MTRILLHRLTVSYRILSAYCQAFRLLSQRQPMHRLGCLVGCQCQLLMEVSACDQCVIARLRLWRGAISSRSHLYYFALI